jgi:hypothetical protein
MNKEEDKFISSIVRAERQKVKIIADFYNETGIYNINKLKNELLKIYTESIIDRRIYNEYMEFLNNFK